DCLRSRGGLALRSEQWLRDIRGADDERRIAERAGESDQIAVERVELIHACVEGGSDVQGIFGTQSVVVPDQLACSLGHRSIYVTHDDPCMLKEALDELGLLLCQNERTAFRPEHLGDS